MKFRRALFWDINARDIERVLLESDDWVIGRVFEYGTLKDIDDVILLYGAEKTKQALLAQKMSKMTAAMAYLFLNIEPQSKYAL